MRIVKICIIKKNNIKPIYSLNNKVVLTKIIQIAKLYILLSESAHQKASARVLRKNTIKARISAQRRE